MNLLVLSQLLVPHAHSLGLRLELQRVLGQLAVPLLDQALHIHRAEKVNIMAMIECEDSDTDKNAMNNFHTCIRQGLTEERAPQPGLQEPLHRQQGQQSKLQRRGSRWHQIRRQQEQEWSQNHPWPA